MQPGLHFVQTVPYCINVNRSCDLLGTTAWLIILQDHINLACTDTADTVMMMQNPVTTIAWLSADVSLLGPLVSLTIDTKEFCLGLFRTKVVLLFSLTQGIMVCFTVLLRPHHHAIFMSTFLRLYSFQHSFRFEVAGLILAGIVAYAIVVNASRRLLDRLQRSRVHPA